MTALAPILFAAAAVICIALVRRTMLANGSAIHALYREWLRRQEPLHLETHWVDTARDRQANTRRQRIRVSGRADKPAGANPSGRHHKAIPKPVTHRLHQARQRQDDAA
ncbi:hypothetical protein [Novosphingobium sp. 9]|uniref:hypothetical protein n=1 Tax=Novosphingobium sp. 9 TaxID=2025349 RepID=UPI0021B648B0|nr:hypothetical protein [Novosphingobium sp. 9]